MRKSDSNSVRATHERLPSPGQFLAISVKQPWAALLVAGVKTVEVRTWRTRKHGPILIHAAKIPDNRPEGWALITTPTLKELARLQGGIIGVANLTTCLKYSTPEVFAKAEDAHRNAPDWFREGGLYGFVFQDARPIAYHACPGRTLFFTVEGITLL